MIIEYCRTVISKLFITGLLQSQSGVGGVKRPKAKVCVLREEGSNGDREMLSAFHEAGLEAWDVNTHDLLQGVGLLIYSLYR